MYYERWFLVRSSEINIIENIVWFLDRECVNYSKMGNKEINLLKFYGWFGSMLNVVLEDVGIVRKRKVSGLRVLGFFLYNIVVDFWFLVLVVV